MPPTNPTSATIPDGVLSTSRTRPTAAPAGASAGAKEPRFAFGENWARFLRELTPERIEVATASLRDMLEVADLRGKRFLDVGCGSGLFSLAAWRLGAVVHSFDYDARSVACAAELRRRFFADGDDDGWVVEQGSVLDEDYIRGLGTFDVVYSWGVLHHTGAMWRALELVTLPVADPGGRLFISIYNRQRPLVTKLATWMKRRTAAMPRAGQAIVAAAYLAYAAPINLAVDLIHRRNPLTRYRTYQSLRGMSQWHDVVDWVGGYPYETATPEEVFDFYRRRGFVLDRLATAGGTHACNEFVFTRRR